MPSGPDPAPHTPEPANPPPDPDHARGTPDPPPVPDPAPGTPESPAPDPAPGGPPAIELRGITKRFPGVVANNGIDLTVAPGEIHAICGENGAGKSTLMKILYGMQAPDSGTISLGAASVVRTV